MSTPSGIIKTSLAEHYRNAEPVTKKYLEHAERSVDLVKRLAKAYLEEKCPEAFVPDVAHVIQIDARRTPDDVEKQLDALLERTEGSLKFAFLDPNTLKIIVVLGNE